MMCLVNISVIKMGHIKEQKRLFPFYTRLMKSAKTYIKAGFIVMGFIMCGINEAQDQAELEIAYLSMRNCIVK